MQRGLVVEGWGEGFGGGGVAESVVGVVVDLLGDAGEVGLVVGDGGAFGEAGADEAVGVLVAGSLPGRVRIGEVDRDPVWPG